MAPPNAPSDASPTSPADADASSGARVQTLAGLVAGPLVLVGMLLAPVPEGLSPGAWHAAAVGLLMAIWWITEAIPIPATSLLPLVFFPLLGVGTIQETASPYAHPLIFLFLGGFLLALGMQRWGLHRRTALTIIRAIGTNPRSILLGFMVASAALSMWVSNTATAMMMLPIGLSVVQLVRDSDAAEDRVRTFAVVLMLGVAYACNIGGTGTIIGTPPNALLAGFMSETYGVELGFAEWMTVGLPFVVLGLPLAYVLLTRVAFSMDLERLPGGHALIRDELERLGPMSRPEWMVAAVFIAVATLWITRPLLSDAVPGLSDAGIAMAGATALFVLPADKRFSTFVLDWDTARDLPWGVLLLFGGGLSLASAVERTGLATWIGESLSAASVLPVVLVIAAVSITIILLTELTSNTATTAAFLPVMASVAVGIGQNPYLLLVPTALSASCAFMLPVATPPNAIVYGSNVLQISDMARAGVWLNVAFAVLVTAVAYGLVVAVFGFDLGVVPSWAQ